MDERYCIRGMYGEGPLIFTTDLELIGNNTNSSTDSYVTSSHCRCVHGAMIKNDKRHNTLEKQSRPRKMRTRAHRFIFFKNTLEFISDNSSRILGASTINTTTDVSDAPSNSS